MVNIICTGAGNISTHTLRKEGDVFDIIYHPLSTPFQPTPSARRVTTILAKIAKMELISTHTLRKEGDRLGS